MNITVLTGSMGSGKSETLINIVSKLESYYEDKDNIVVCASLSCCRIENYISSRNGEKHRANMVSSFEDILALLKNNHKAKVLLVDEVQLIEGRLNKIIELINYCTDENIDIYFSGLEINCLGEPFPIMGILFCYADEIIKLKGTCAICGKENSSSRAIRYADGKIDKDKLVVKPDTNKVSITVNEDRMKEVMKQTNIEYKAVCKECFLKEMRKYEDALNRK